MKKNFPSNEIFINMIQSCSDGIFVSDTDYNTIVYSEVYRKYLGASELEMKNNSILDFYNKGWLSEIPIKTVIEKKEEYSTIIKYFKTNREILVTGVPIFEKNKIKYAILTFRDMVELKSLEEQLNYSYYLIEKYRAKLKKINNDIENKIDKYGLVYSSDLMQKLVTKIESIACYNLNVLITGETGVGKSILARVIHNLSERSEKGKFVKIDCSCIPENLIESELFGYESGAFTGASKEGKKGLVEQSEAGTLFLDEIAELPLQLQAKLLSVLEDREVKRIGGTNSHPINFRVIAATNRDIEQMVKEGKFRKDLYYRINVISIDVPSLRERPCDIITLFKYYEKLYSDEYKMEQKLDENYYKAMLEYDWPGNVRELVNFTKKTIFLNKDEVLKEMYKWKIKNNNFSDLIYSSNKILAIKSLQEYIDIQEKKYINQIVNNSTTLKECANKLEIDVSTLYRKMKKYGIKKL